MIRGKGQICLTNKKGMTPMIVGAFFGWCIQVDLEGDLKNTIKTSNLWVSYDLRICHACDMSQAELLGAFFARFICTVMKESHLN
jgi:hypothetical protein